MHCILSSDIQNIVSNIFDFCKILKIHEKKSKSAKKLFLFFFQREDVERLSNY